ncbi:retron Ec67 family RNA-directed DNA polymerase/endonuclease [Ottowia sp.]|uniref:retron Ec67 family RNA-directed DNA polymerase/endonuclease n=1 Tax=Ottowia sp. TaxID=1898956 RepID=UPI001D5F680A|nr:retron Ec67 family RNA-directed DNA polymerase/endonuclease [Nitratireductor sp.]MCB2026645.1 retron Ec67 family RNA-directed DNA polymerase/endonuclease [Ottowia sp.]HPR06879.1 retron Ec67 family RNA-directed DNA polymerase/endonuclease [Denitromonas sp.]
MSQLTRLKAATSLSDVARLLEVKPGMLSFLLYKKPKAALYAKFSIPKRHGGTREIWAPDKDLKLVQHRLANLLQNCVDEINAARGHAEDDKRHGIAHGFKRKHTIMTNARVHVTRRYVFNVDLHDFFGTINFGRVRGFFLKDKNFTLHERVATVIAQIACHDNKLPQGSPCSPVISNLIGHMMDILLVRLASATGCSYSRYADDLTFSSNRSNFSPRVARQDDDDKDLWLPGQGLKRLVAKAGFSFNDRKTRMQYRDSRQDVTGLVVNRKVNVPATYRHTVRAMVDHAIKTGSFERIFKKVDAAGIETAFRQPGTNRQLIGMLSYIDQVDLFNRKLREDHGLEPHNTSGRTELFRRFLYFDSFHAIESPVIVCEGPTDNIYLRHAIKRLAPAYPTLASGTPPQLSVRLFRYGQRRISQVTQLTGGVGGLCHLMKHYNSDFTTKIKAPAPRYPVIVLVDNDAGAKPIYGAISGITKKPRPTGAERFIHVVGNMYVVPTPLGAGDAATAIEDFFDAKTLNEKLGTKTFSRAAKFDDTKHFGKAAFAREVVERKADFIDFSRFSDILDRVVAVMSDYAKRYPSLP